MKRTALDFIAREHWAITEQALDLICTIASREHEYSQNISALEQKLGRPLNNTRDVTVRDGVALIPVSGPLFRHANLMTELSGATSYAALATDLREALDSPDVHSIVMMFDTPGGHVNGVNELSKQIKATAAIKPVIAYVGGQAASAGYWLASAATKIVADDVANIGSIGAMIGLRINESAKAGEKSYTFVSTQSPFKNADPGTEAGAREIQRLTDELAQAFIDTIAENRGITSEEVLEKYGQGAVFTGKSALSRGMIDEIGTLEGVIESLTQQNAASSGFTFRSSPAMATQNNPAASVTANLTLALVKSDHPEIAQALINEGVASVDIEAIKAEARTEGATAERDRIAAIEAIAMPGTEELVAQFKADGAMTADRAAMEILKQFRQNGAPAAATQAPASASAAHLDGLRKTEQTMSAPAASAPSDGGAEDDLDAQIAADLAAAKAAGVLA